MDIEIFFRSTEAGHAWYVWLRAASQAYFFSSLDNARRFAASLARTRHATASTEVHYCLEQAATLI